MKTEEEKINFNKKDEIPPKQNEKQSENHELKETEKTIKRKSNNDYIINYIKGAKEFDNLNSERNKKSKEEIIQEVNGWFDNFPKYEEQTKELDNRLKSNKLYIALNDIGAAVGEFLANKKGKAGVKINPYEKYRKARKAYEDLQKKINEENYNDAKIKFGSVVNSLRNNNELDIENSKRRDGFAREFAKQNTNEIIEKYEDKTQKNKEKEDDFARKLELLKKKHEYEIKRDAQKINAYVNNRSVIYTLPNGIKTSDYNVAKTELEKEISKMSENEKNELFEKISERNLSYNDFGKLTEKRKINLNDEKTVRAALEVINSNYNNSEDKFMILQQLLED